MRKVGGEWQIVAMVQLGHMTNVNSYMYKNHKHSGSPCVYKARWCAQTSYAYSLLMRANRLETAAAQGLLACLFPLGQLCSCNSRNNHAVSCS